MCQCVDVRTYGRRNEDSGRTNHKGKAPHGHAMKDQSTIKRKIFLLKPDNLINFVFEASAACFFLKGSQIKRRKPKSVNDQKFSMHGKPLGWFCNQALY